MSSEPIATTELLLLRAVDSKVAFRYEQHPQPRNETSEDHVRNLLHRVHPAHDSNPYAQMVTRRLDPENMQLITTWVIAPDPYLAHGYSILGRLPKQAPRAVIDIHDVADLAARSVARQLVHTDAPEALIADHDLVTALLRLEPPRP